MQLCFFLDPTIKSQSGGEITVRMFAKYAHELPPLKGVGDFVFLKDVIIDEWKGGYDFMSLFRFC